MISRTEILDTLKGVYNKYDGIRLGLAGSYANNMATKNSDIDVVIDGDSMRMDIAEYIKSLFLLPVDILWLELLKEDDEEMDRFARSIGVPENEYSVYKIIRKEVQWVDKVSSISTPPSQTILGI